MHEDYPRGYSYITLEAGQFMKRNHSKQFLLAFWIPSILVCVQSTVNSAPVTPQKQPIPFLQLSYLKKALGGSLYVKAGGPSLNSVFGGWCTVPGPPEDLLHGLAQYIVSRSNGANSINYKLLSQAVMQHYYMSGGPISLNFKRVGRPTSGVAVADAFNPPPGGNGLAFNNMNFNSMGPLNLIGVSQFGEGPSQVSGRVNGIAIDPLNTNVIYIASAGGGVWKTTDGGVTWVPLSDKWPALATASVAIDPVHDNIVYAGTGDIAYGTTPFGLETSTDGGTTWSNTGRSIFGNKTVTKILIDPTNDNTILVSTGYPGNGGVYRSTNGGSSWTQVLSGAVFEDLEVGDVGGTPVFYAAGSYNDVLYSSTDDGVTWSKIYSGNGGSGIAVAPSKVSNSVVYLMLGSQKMVLESINSGGSWTNISHELTSEDLPSFTTSIWAYPWYDYEMKCNLENGQDVLYMGLLDIYRYTGKSDASGQYWPSMLGTYTGNDLAHTDQHDFLIDPTNPSHFLIGNDGGIYSVNESGTLQSPSFSYTSLNSDLDITQFYGIDVNPADNAWILGGSQDNGTNSTNASGPGTSNISHWTGVYGGDGIQCAIDPQNPAIQFASSQDDNIVTTSDYWINGSYIRPPVSGVQSYPFDTLITRDPNDGSVIYTGTNYLYRYNGTNWQADLGNQDLAGNGGVVTTIAVAPSNSSILYTGSTHGMMWISTNQGANWKEIDESKFSFISKISVSPVNPYSIVVAGGGSYGPVSECINTNPTSGSPLWSNIGGVTGYSLPGFGMNAICRNPFDPNNFFYCGNDTGAYYTPDNGKHWYNLNVGSNLPDAQISMMRSTLGTGSLAGDAFLTIATYGRGVWQAPLVNVLQINSLSPADIAQGSGSTLLTVNGAHFNPGDVVQWNGVGLTTSYVSSNQLTATIPASDLVSSSVDSITVMDPATGDVSNIEQLAVGRVQLQAKFGAVTELGNGTFQTVVTISNVGAVAATGVSFVSSTLDKKNATSEMLGSSSIAANSSVSLTLVFPSGIPAGSQVLLLKLAYSGGQLQSGALVTVP